MNSDVGGADARLKYWLWLGALAGIDAKRAKRLLDVFANPYEIFRQRRESLLKLDFMNDRLLGLILDPAARSDLDEKTASFAERGIQIISMEDERYPRYVREIEDPPPVLFMRGSNPARDADRCIAVVGARRPTAYGAVMTRKIVAGLAAFGFTVVSGLAMGIDAIAHKTALEAGVKTIAFLGCGVEQAYPVCNRKLMDDVVSRGAVYSEYLPGTAPFQQNFPQRNRLISGTSAAVVVIEAGERSGALITARYAGEQGRDVFAVPGNATSPLSRGANALLRDGALIATSAEDIVFSLNRFIAPGDGGDGQMSLLGEEQAGAPGGGRSGEKDAAQGGAPSAGQGVAPSAAPQRDGVKARGRSLDTLAEAERRVVKLLRGRGPMDADGIAGQCKITAAEAGSTLVTLEIKGFLQRMPGGLYGCADD